MAPPYHFHQLPLLTMPPSSPPTATPIDGITTGEVPVTTIDNRQSITRASTSGPSKDSQVRTALLPRLLLRRSVRLGNRYHNEFLYSDVLLIFKIMYLYIYRCHSFWFAIIHCRKHRPKSRVILRNSARNTASSSHSKARSTKSNFY
jgi:hypothetical protein